MHDETDGDELRISTDGLIILLEVRYGVRVSIHEGLRDEFIARAVSSVENPRYLEEHASGSTFEDALDRLDEVLESVTGADGSRFGS